jgi:hypothetical protein
MRVTSTYASLAVNTSVANILAPSAASAQGFQRVADNLADTQLDNPAARDRFEAVVKAALTGKAPPGPGPAVSSFAAACADQPAGGELACTASCLLACCSGWLTGRWLWRPCCRRVDRGGLLGIPHLPR